MSVKKVDSPEALRLHRESVPYLDVRSVQEFEAGHAPGAWNVPLMHLTPAGMQPNPEFESVVQRAFDKDRAVMVACRSGGRSARAATILQQLGFQTIYDYTGGWGGNASDPGWVAAGGPTTTTPERGRAYAELAKS